MSSVLEICLARLDPDHAHALEWFAEHEGEIGPRPWRVDGVSVVPGVKVPLVAQRGIHQPSGWPLALSVTATRTSVYLDGIPKQIDSDTWVLPYDAHSGGDGDGTASRWNQALLTNIAERVPVGVFVPAGRTYRNLGLAMVEAYDSGSRSFTLRGPVRYSQQQGVWLDADEELGQREWTAAEDSDSPRVPTLVRRRHAQDRFRDALLKAYAGRCAVTGYDANDALQGAHIIEYRGKSSQLVENGLLLRADIHLLFDRHLLSVDPENGRVMIGARLRSSRYAELDRKPLLLPRESHDRPDRHRLAVHWSVFQRAAN